LESSSHQVRIWVAVCDLRACTCSLEDASLTLLQWDASIAAFLLASCQSLLFFLPLFNRCFFSCLFSIAAFFLASSQSLLFFLPLVPIIPPPAFFVL
jgi:hypothetical protein